MTKLLRNSVLLLAGLLALSPIIGCGSDEEDAEPIPTNFVSGDPPNGSTIAANASITLTFDNAPVNVTSSTGVATAAGKTVTVAGPFTLGALSLTITWADGTQTLTYTVTGPD